MPPIRTCSHCGKPVAPRAANPAFPFCSDRCRLLDLGKWLDEEYRVPGGRPGDGSVDASGVNPEEES
jgi:endogenous inhibitor of DNA gyrase (YacG/DUF329 family)